MFRITTLYWNNIDPRIVQIQKRVFQHFGFDIDQQEQTGVRHGDFIDRVMAEAGADDVVLIVDIDCIPLNREIIVQALLAARDGRVFGCAQSANHIDPDRIYVGPMFMALSRRTWDALGQPSFNADQQHDVAQRVHDLAVAAGVPTEILYPWAAIVPKWRLSDIALFGVGTFYRGGVFHLFESRGPAFDFILFDVAEAVLNRQPVDYLMLMRKAAEARHGRI